jgi:hypothetical protein
MHPATPIMIWRPSLRRSAFQYDRRDIIFCSALSRMEQVFMITAAASVSISVSEYPAIPIMVAITSLSATFIWHPYVSMRTFLSCVQFLSSEGKKNGFIIGSIRI